MKTTVKDKKCPVCERMFTPRGIQKHCGPKCYYKDMGKKVYKMVKRIAIKRTKLKVTPRKDDEFVKNSALLRAKQVLEHDHTFCEICKKPGPVECHHIIYRSEKPGHIMLHSRENLILLCNYHHNFMHETKKNRYKLVLDRKLDELFGKDVIK